VNKYNVHNALDMVENIDHDELSRTISLISGFSLSISAGIIILSFTLSIRASFGTSKIF
jgi:hypothetical protein